MHVKFIKKGSGKKYFTGDFTKTLGISEDIKIGDYSANVSDIEER